MYIDQNATKRNRSWGRTIHSDPDRLTKKTDEKGKSV
jgi:hypothetical protein